MSRCGICGGGISLTVVPHAHLCDDNTKAQSQPMCGDCLVPINECGHGYDLRRKRDRHHSKTHRHSNGARVLYN
jgi:hypothetical protein